MNKWVRIQDKITSMRAPAGIMLLIFLCIASVFLVLVGPTMQLYFNHKTKGVVTNYEILLEDGLASHHFQAVNLYGNVRYDLPMDIMGENNHVLIRTILIQDEVTHSAVLMNNHKMYSLRDTQMKNVEGIVRKMSTETYAYFLDSFGNDIAALKAEGWKIDTRYYINESESLPNPEGVQGILIFAAVNGGLILLCLLPFLIPYPKTIHKIVKSNNK